MLAKRKEVGSLVYRLVRLLASGRIGCMAHVCSLWGWNEALGGSPVCRLVGLACYFLVMAVAWHMCVVLLGKTRWDSPVCRLVRLSRLVVHECHSLVNTLCTD